MNRWYALRVSGGGIGSEAFGKATDPRGNAGLLGGAAG